MVGPLPSAAAEPVLKMVSVSTGGEQGNGFSGAPALSATGRITGFTSYADDLVSGDDNTASDVFVHNRKTSKTNLISRSTSGTHGNDQSAHAAISASGRYVAFSSLSDNLVRNDDNERSDVFLRDRKKRTTVRISVSSSGAQSDRHSFYPSVSADGRFIAFYSEATNFDPNDENGFGDVYLRDREAKTTTRISVTTNGDEAVGGRNTYPRISADGRFVTFVSFASNLSPLDTNALRDVYLRDLVAETTTRVSATGIDSDAAGESTYPSISADGRYVAYHSTAPDLVADDTNGAADVFLWDRVTDITTRESVSSSEGQGSQASSFAWLSGDGRILMFESRAPDLVDPDDNAASDVFLRDLNEGTTTLISSSPDGSAGEGASKSGVISRDASRIAFTSGAIDLVPGDSNEADDVFLLGPML